MFIDIRVLCYYDVNGIFHPNGTSECVKAGGKFGATKGSGDSWQVYPPCAGCKVTIKKHGLKRYLPAALW